jgi:arginine decarboxylase
LPKTWSIDKARELYNLRGWGHGYFDINEKGHVLVNPRKDPDGGIDLYELAGDLNAQGVGYPILVRFSDILRSRIEKINDCFSKAIAEIGYGAGYTAVYPIKVNQQRRVVREIAEFGKPLGVGLEVGSKPELQAVLAMSEDTDTLVVCNGYKDEEYMRLALMGQKLGHRVFIVLEMVHEVDLLLRCARELDVRPTVGVRVKLASAGSGKWAESAGEKSKFGLNPAQLVQIVDRLRAEDALDILQLLHVHIGSQVPDIRTFKVSLAEVARFYSELRGLGVNITHVDVGGGLGVDYEGSRVPGTSGTNYSIQEYANDIVYTLHEACEAKELPAPHIISESGRALTAHHALLLVNVIDVESQGVAPQIMVDPENDHQVLQLLADSLAEVRTRSLRELYHDAIFSKERARELFASGVLSLRDASRADQIYLQILDAIARHGSWSTHEDILSEIQNELVDRYFCNFSLFQSLPDSWAVGQLFPILPIHRLDEEPTRRGSLHDITCDSDGRIDRFVGGRRQKTTLELHAVEPGEPYVLGIFLAGAYQEILGDLHNLFGDTNAVHVRLRNGSYEVTDLVEGDTVSKVLQYVAFDPQELVTTFRRKVARARLSREQRNSFIAEYVDGLDGYTYLEEGLPEAEESAAPAPGHESREA